MTLDQSLTCFDRAGYVRKAWPALLLLSLLLRTAPLSGGTIYATGFENPPFANHSTLVGQDGWIAPPPLSPNAAQVATGIHAAGQQAMRVDGRDLEQQDFINQATGGYYDAIGSYRHPVNYDTQGTETVRVSADVYVRGGQQTPEGDNFFSASIVALAALTNGGVAGTGELAVSSDGHVYGHSGNALVPTFLTSAPITLDAWHNLAVDADYADRSYSFFVDGSALGTFPFDATPDTDDPSADYNNMFLRGSMIAYAGPDTESLKKQNFAAYFDNFSITAPPAMASIPEPASMGLLLTGVVLLSLGRRPGFGGAR